MAFEDDDESPAVETDDSDRASQGGLDDFGAPDGGGAMEAYADKPAQLNEPQGGTFEPSAMDLVKNILNYGRQVTGLQSDHQKDINAAQDSTANMMAEWSKDAQPWEGPQDGGMFAGAPESTNIEDRRGEKPGAGVGDVMKKLGNVGRNFAAGGLVEEEEDPEAPAVDFGSADPAQAAPVDDSQAPTEGGVAGQDQQHMMPDEDQGALTKFSKAMKTLPRPGDKPMEGEQPGLGARVQTGVQAFMRYLQGADASPSDQIIQLERQVDPQGALDEDTRKMKVVEAAHQQGGEQAAWGALQHYRQKYDRYRGFAAAALKAGNIAAATKAATQSYSNLMDGNTVLFTPSADGGVLASVSKPRNNRLNTLSKTMDVSSTVALSPQQFQEWLTGMPGQYDNAIENGAPKVLAQLAQGQNTQAPAPSPSQSVTGNPAGPGVSATAPPPMSGRTNRVAEMGTPPEVREPGALPAQGGDDRPFAAKGVGKPGQYRELPGNYRSPKTAEEEFPDDPKQKAMAERLHPGDKQAQAGSVYAQGQQQKKNEIDMARASKEYEVDKARINSAGRVGAAQVRGDSSVARAKEVNKGKIAVELAKLQNNTQNAHEKNLYKMIGDVVKVMPFGVDGDKASQFIDAELKKRGVDPSVARKVPALQDIYGEGGEEGPAAPQGPAAATQVKQPQQKFTPPPDWQYSASRKQYRDKKGVVYDVNGKRVQ